MDGNGASTSRIAWQSQLFTFTAANYGVNQTATISAINDYIARGEASFSASPQVLSADFNYMGISVEDITVILKDDETGAFCVA